MRYRPIDSDPEDSRLGRFIPDDWGHRRNTMREDYQPAANNGISRFRWARSVEEVHSVLGNERADELGAVPILNSWGRSYPHRTWMPDDVLERLMREEGEVAIPTDH